MNYYVFLIGKLEPNCLFRIRSGEHIIRPIQRLNCVAPISQFATETSFSFYFRRKSCTFYPRFRAQCESLHMRNFLLHFSTLLMNRKTQQYFTSELSLRYVVFRFCLVPFIRRLFVNTTASNPTDLLRAALPCKRYKQILIQADIFAHVLRLQQQSRRADTFVAGVKLDWERS